MFKYLRYIATPFLVTMAIFFAAKGQYWIWVYEAIFFIIIIGGDLIFGDDKSHPEFQKTKFLNLLLYLNLPLIYILVIVSIWMSGDSTLPSWGTSLLAARNNTTLLHLAGYVLSLLHI